MLYLDFSYNWNGKLICFNFSTIRLYNPEKYKINQQYRCRLKVKNEWVELGTVRLINITHFHLGELTNNMSYLDTGYNKEQTRAIISKMYQQEVERSNNSLELGMYVFAWETRTVGWFEHLGNSIMKRYDELIVAEGIFQTQNQQNELKQPVQVELGI